MPSAPSPSTTCRVMSDAVDAAAEHAAGEGRKKLPEKEEKNPATEQGKNLGEGGGTHLNSEQITCFASTLDEQDPDVEKTQHAKKLASDDSGEKTQMPTNTEEHTCLMVVPGEGNDSNNLQMKKKKVKKRKRSELRQIKKEQHLIFRLRK